MTSLDRIQLAIDAEARRSTQATRREVRRAYQWAADVIAGTYRRPDKPVISETTPPWIARGKT